MSGVLLMAFCFFLDKRLHKTVDKIHKDEHKIHEKLNNQTHEAIENIKSLKFYSWEEYFEKEIVKTKAEVLERSRTRESYYILFTLMWVVLPDMMHSFSFSTYMYFGNAIDLAQALEIVTLFHIIRGPMGHISWLRQ